LSVAVAPRARRRRPSGPKWLWGLAYATPAVAIVGIFVVYPFGSILYHAFTRWDGLSPAQWVGLHNFRVLWNDPIFLNALKNNGLFAISVPVQILLPLFVAYVIHRRVPGWRFFRSTVFLPAVYATVVIGILAYTVLQLGGPLNSALGSVGLGSLKHEWLGSAGTSIPVILLIVIWTNFGYNVLLYLAGMSAIDPSIEEAARIDGAGWFRVLRFIIVPNLRRVMEIVLVINTITAFAFMFTYIYTITNGGPGYDTYVAEYYIWNQAFTNQNMGYAAAIGVTLVLMVLVVGMVQIRALTRRSA
jgi:multiple sugar transport system permease protein